MKNVKLIAFLSLAGAQVAGAAALPVRPPAPANLASSAGDPVVIAPTAYQTYMDAYNQGAGHFLFGTADPNGVDCLLSTGPSSCPAGTLIGRAAYIGGFDNGGTNTFTNTSGIDGVSLFVFDAAQIPAGAKSFAVRLTQMQNFTGRGFRLSVKVLENRGDNGVDPGAEGCFKDLGPFGIPTAGSLTTVVSDGRSERADNNSAGYSVPANGPLNAHPADPGPPYLTFDRDALVPLGDISADVELALASGVSYTSCRNSCNPPLVRNADCDIAVSNPLYIAVTASVGGGDRGNERIQDSIAVDNLIHIHGDCDFAGEDVPGTLTKVELLAYPTSAP